MVDNTKELIISELKGNPHIKSILNEFIKDFRENYKTSNDEARELMMRNRDGIFRKFLFSTILEDTYITPCYMVNGIAQNYYKGEYLILPHIKIQEKEEGKLSFKKEFIYYSMDEHPVIADIEKLIKHTNPVITIRNENMYIIDGGEEFIEKINFRSGYYIQYLIGIAQEIGILSDIPSIGCEVYEVAPNYERYKKLSNKEKFIEIYRGSIEYSSRELQLNEVTGLIKCKPMVIELLNNNVTFDKIYEFSKVVGKEYKDFMSNIDGIVNDIDIKQSLIQANNESKGELHMHMADLKMGIPMDMYFNVVFGYYLGVITPVYNGLIIIKEIIDGLRKAVFTEQYLLCLFRNIGCYDLSPLGEQVLREEKIEVNNKLFRGLEDCFVEQIIYGYKDTIGLYREQYDTLNSMTVEEQKSFFKEIENCINALGEDFFQCEEE